jgi:hypothetical protein
MQTVAKNHALTDKLQSKSIVVYQPGSATLG